MTNWTETPLVLTVNDVAKILNIGRNNAYDLFHRPDFPSVRAGKILRVSRDAFCNWLEKGKGVD